MKIRSHWTVLLTAFVLVTGGCGGGDNSPHDLGWLKSQTKASDVAAAGKTLTVTIPISDNLTKGMIKDGFWIDAGKVIKAAQSTETTAKDLVVKGTYPMQDNRGNSLGDMVVMRGEWDDFAGINVARVSDFEAAANKTWVHPAVN